MSVRVIVPPQPIVELAEAKEFLRVDHEDDDTMISSLIVAAQSEFDGPNGWLGRAVGAQTLEATFDGFCRRMPLPYPEAIEILSVSYRGCDGVPHTADSALYELDEGDVLLKSGGSWPSVPFGTSGVTVRYTAATVSDVPALERMRLAIKIHVRAHYDHEESTWRFTFDALLSSLQKFR